MAQRTVSDETKGQSHHYVDRSLLTMCYEDGDDDRTASPPSTDNTKKTAPGINVHSVELLVTDEENQKHDVLTDVPNDSGKTESTIGSSQPGPSAAPVTVTGTRGPPQLFSQGQIDSYTARVLAMEKSLGAPDAKTDPRPSRVEPPRGFECADCSYLKCEQPRTRSPSVPNNLTLGDICDDVSPSGSRKGLSPLFELRRPHCTLNCEHCNLIMEERLRHSRSSVYKHPHAEKVLM